MLGFLKLGMFLVFDLWLLHIHEMDRRLIRSRESLYLFWAYFSTYFLKTEEFPDFVAFVSWFFRGEWMVPIFTLFITSIEILVGVEVFLTRFNVSFWWLLEKSFIIVWL